MPYFNYNRVINSNTITGLLLGKIAMLMLVFITFGGGATAAKANQYIPAQGFITTWDTTKPGATNNRSIRITTNPWFRNQGHLFCCYLFPKFSAEP
jgi:hypothetical protein